MFAAPAANNVVPFAHIPVETARIVALNVVRKYHMFAVQALDDCGSLQVRTTFPLEREEQVLRRSDVLGAGDYFICKQKYLASLLQAQAFSASAKRL